MLTILGCEKYERLKISSPDRTQIITIITDSNTRYIINDNHKNIPDFGYIKLDISKIGIGDEIGICWKTDKYEWELINNKAIILENKLDTTKYKFNTKWDSDKKGIPNALKFHSPNCGTYGFESKTVYQNKGLVID